MSRLSLAGIGWVTEEPRGNRLRWSWPADAADGEAHVLPEVIQIERAPIDQEMSFGEPWYGPSQTAPTTYWIGHPDVQLPAGSPGSMPAYHALGAHVQAVRFRYHGPPTVVHAFDGLECVVTKPIADSEYVHLHAPSLDGLLFMAAYCSLKDLQTLDLYDPPPLEFEVIAQINLSATGAVGLSLAATRYPSGPTIADGEWDDLRSLWTAAWAEAPLAPGSEGAPNRYTELQVVLGTRWEYATLCGLGFFDGPTHGDPEFAEGQPALDNWWGLLKEPEAVAYRVIDPGGQLDPSNVVYIPAAVAPALTTPPAPTVENVAVRLDEKGAIVATWEMAWATGDPALVGVLVEETLTVGAATTVSEYAARGHREDDPPGAGFVHRELVVAHHDVSVSARLAAQDGFDRSGEYGSASAITKLPIDHYPQPPPLLNARNDGSTTTLTQPSPGDWGPDPIVKDAGGTVRFYRRVWEPARFSAPVMEAIPNGRSLAVWLAQPAPSDPAAFVGGRITMGSLKGTITLVFWPVVLVDLGQGDGPIASVPSLAIAELSQSQTHPGLFKLVSTQAATSVQADIAFADAPPATPMAELFEYRAQVAFAGQAGPMGPAVQALRLPPTPAVPDPFTVTPLGVDSFARTLVQVTLTKESTDLLDVWWADGTVSGKAFLQQAVPGDTGPQYAEDKKILFETLSLPVPGAMARTVTIGVQAVNAADGRSAFATVPTVLPKP